jgi:type I restriction enzyme S subunit
VKSGWQARKLVEVCSFINRGISPRYLESGGICVLNQKCIRDHSVSYEPSRRHDAQSKKVGNDRFIKVGDVLVNSTGTGTLGRVAQLRENPSEPTTVDSHVTIVRPKQGMFYQDFFGYMLVVIEDAIKEAGDGCGGQTELARSILAEKFLVHYPESLPEQQRIVGILDEAFDGIATAKANAEKNLQNTRALFESYLYSLFSQRGEGWGEKNFDEICVLQRGFDLPTHSRKEGIFPLVSSNGITDRIDTWKVKAPGVVTGRSGTIGNVHYIEEDYWPLNTALYIKDFHGNYERCIYYFLKQFDLDKYSSGAGVPTLNRNNVHSLRIWFPTHIAEQKSIAVKLDAISEETKRLESRYQRKIGALDELKKSLLHQAFAGKL